MRFWTWLLARLIAVGVILGLALWYRMPASGEREFRRSIEALKAVNSFHYAMVADMPTQHTEQEGDVACTEDAAHQATRVVVHRPDQDISLNTEVIRVGGMQYNLLPSGLWSHSPLAGQSGRVICQPVVADGHVAILPEFDQMAEHGVIERGDKKTVNGGVCREWRVTLRNGPGPLLPRSPDAYEHRTLCLGVDDHLPREMTSSANPGRWTWAFNTSTRIEAPTALAPDPVQNDYRPPPPGLTLSDDKDDKN
jgi:hypothetical protein